MHKELEQVPSRILDIATGALIQANQHAVYYDPGMVHWENMAVLNAATAGELFLKAIITKEHPLLIFKDLFQLDDPSNNDLRIEHVIEKGKTYNFEHLPKLLWVATGVRLPDIESFEKLRKARNSIQHFCSPPEKDLRKLSLEFIYNNIDSLIHKHFGMYAIEYHEEKNVGYDYVVRCLINNEILFSIPDDFEVTEIDLEEEVSSTSQAYKNRLKERFLEKGLDLI